MQIGSYLWKGFNGTLDYGFRKLDEGTGRVSSATFMVAHKILQTRPDGWFAHRFSPRLHEAMLWIENNPIAINRAVNLCKLGGDIVQGEISLDTITHLVQLFIDDKTNPKWNRLLTFINAISIYQIGTDQLLGPQNPQLSKLIDSFVLLHNICYNNAMIEKYNHNKAIENGEK